MRMVVKEGLVLQGMKAQRLQEQLLALLHHTAHPWRSLALLIPFELPEAWTDLLIVNNLVVYKAPNIFERSEYKENQYLHELDVWTKSMFK
ncbi:hypothetical protein Taro_044547 [Colocasia esculenta]|uniref:Uncharacterized protein n=1 Tax=Colocasia esculenta TaxID=4460 RepID=A0A843WUB4_COLES|nr:hypothetical protein [Colocasia esculenta]